MIVDYRTIRSSASVDDSRPYYDLSVDGDDLVVEIDGDGGTEVDLSGESIRVNTSQDSVVAVSSEGELISYPNGEDHDLRAHLAWFDSESDTLTVLEFVESE